MPVIWTPCRFLAFDATPIRYYRCQPAGPVKGICLIIHGVGEHAARYRAVAESLAEIGIYSLAMDLRGFGESGGKRGCWKSFKDFSKDISALHTLALSERKNHVPLYLLGHSFGGLLCVHYTATDNSSQEINGLILSSPFFGLSQKPPFWKRALAKTAAFILPDLTQSTGVEPEILTHDKDIIASYKKDSLNHSRMSAGFYQRMMKLLGMTPFVAGRLRLPVLILQAGRDKVASVEATKKFFDQLPARDKKLLIYENDFHEIFNELDRTSVFKALGEWVKAHLAV